MKRSQRTHLMHEIMAGDDLAEFRQTSLDLGLQFISRRKRRRRILRATALGALPLLCVFVLIATKQPRPTSDSSATATQPTSKSPTQPLLVAQALSPGPHQARPAKGAIKFITDEQLLALFPNRSVALIGNPGRQQFVFLDRPAR